MGLTLDLGNALGYIAMLFTLASFTMKRMLPLRGQEAALAAA